MMMNGDGFSNSKHVPARAFAEWSKVLPVRCDPKTRKQRLSSLFIASSTSQLLCVHTIYPRVTNIQVYTKVQTISDRTESILTVTTPTGALDHVAQLLTGSAIVHLGDFSLTATIQYAVLCTGISEPKAQQPRLSDNPTFSMLPNLMLSWLFRIVNGICMVL
jgi:hypothetical protein